MKALILPAPFQEWASMAAELGFVDFLSAEDGFRTCFDSGRAWRNHKACGVYFWIAEDGETYVGETVNARGRLLEHARNHLDLRYACFQPIPLEQRKLREAELIEHVNRVYPTRNIKRAVSSAAHVPFDQFVSSAQREAHLQGELIEDEGAWRDLPLLTQKHARQFARFRALADADQILGAVFFYVWSVMPRPLATEGRFWSVSLFVGPHLLRINAGQQEVFTVSRGEDRELGARVLAPRPLTLDAEGPVYQTKSYVHWLRLEELPEWLEGDRLIASRELAIRLMRHTTALNSASHCPQMVRAADEWGRSAEVSSY